MLKYLRHGSSETILQTATLRKKLKIKEEREREVGGREGGQVDFGKERSWKKCVFESKS